MASWNESNKKLQQFEEESANTIRIQVETRDNAFSEISKENYRIGTDDYARIRGIIQVANRTIQAINPQRKQLNDLAKDSKKIFMQAKAAESKYRVIVNGPRRKLK